MEGVISKWAITETYEDVLELLMSRVHKFHKRFGGDWNEWLSEAHNIFMDAYYDYDGSAAFTTYLTHLLDRRMVEKVRRPIRQPKARTVAIPKSTVAKPAAFPERLWMELSDDAQTVLGLVIDVPTDIKLMMLENRGRKPKSVKFKECLIEFLFDVGWTGREIWLSFHEIKECL